MKKVFLLIFVCFVFLGCGRHQPVQMILIEGGTFIMGSPFGEHDRDFDEMPHNVTVSSFYMGVFEITQEEYRSVMRRNPSFFKGRNLPVETITWYDAIEYCNRLSKKEGLTPVYSINGTNVTWDRSANGYRLPTEAEWEYAARAGTITPFSTGENIETSQANFNGRFPYNNSLPGVFLETTTEVGSFPPNTWGLYDMHGNVFEMCWDWFDYYTRNEAVRIDPAGPAAGNHRIIRGGSWANGGNVLRSAYRGITFPGLGNDRIGFRIARNAQ
jgi:formylglycine-generating enzyme required for sulfatase activity